MKITEVRVKAVESRNGKLKGWASVTFDDAFVVHNMKIIQGKEGRFVAMPNRKTKEGTYKDIAHPINNETRQEIEDAILKEFDIHLQNESIEYDSDDDTDDSASDADDENSFESL
jgi:stage V sporulation protein G